MKYIKRLARAGGVMTNQPRYVIVDNQTGVTIAHCIGDRRVTLVLDALNRAEELEQKICDSCLVYEDDGTPYTTYGWNENAVEGRIPCACISESGPFQVLENEVVRLLQELQNIANLPYKNSQTLLAPSMASKAIKGFSYEPM